MAKKTLVNVISTAAIAVLLLTGCSLTETSIDDDIKPGSGGSGAQNTTKKVNDFDNPEFENEMDGANPVPEKRKEKEFVGKWATASDYAYYLYGNVSLVINSDHTWSGSITDEAFSGRWVQSNDGIIIKDNEGIINWELFYTTDGSLMFRNKDKPEVALVLKKVK